MVLASQAEKRIMEAATAIFIEKGRDGTRMQEIADRAGINKALVHYYFRSKDRLYETVFMQELQKFFSEFLDSIPVSSDFPIFLRSFIHNYIQRLARRPELIRFVLWEIERGSKSVGSMFKSLFAQRGFTTNPIFDKVQLAIAAGEIRPVDPVNFFLSLIGMCIYPFLARSIIEELFANVRVTDSSFLEKREKEIFDLIWNGIRLKADRNF